jgi:hypothetical protein
MLELDGIRDLAQNHPEQRDVQQRMLPQTL